MADTPTAGLLTRFQMAPGRDEEFEAAVQSALPLVLKQPGALAWFVLKFGDASYAILDAFPNKQARAAHLAGPVGRSVLGDVGPLLATPAHVEPFDVFAHHIAADTGGTTAGKGLLGTFRARQWREAQIETFLRQQVEGTVEDGQTVAAFAMAFGERRFGMFSVSADVAGRAVRAEAARDHLSIHLAALEGGARALEMVDITVAKIAPA